MKPEQGCTGLAVNTRNGARGLGYVTGNGTRETARRVGGADTPPEGTPPQARLVKLIHPGLPASPGVAPASKPAPRAAQAYRPFASGVSALQAATPTQTPAAPQEPGEGRASPRHLA